MTPIAISKTKESGSLKLLSEFSTLTQQKQFAKILLLSLLLFCLSACGAGDILSPSSNSTANADQSNNSVNGVAECETTCEPVDVANCNSSQTVDEANPTCFLVSQHCNIPTGNSGPELSPIAPTDCVFAATLPQDAQGDTASTGIDQGF